MQSNIETPCLCHFGNSIAQCVDGNCQLDQSEIDEEFCATGLVTLVTLSITCQANLMSRHTYPDVLACLLNDKKNLPCHVMNVSHVKKVKEACSSKLCFYYNSHKAVFLPEEL